MRLHARRRPAVLGSTRRGSEEHPRLALQGQKAMADCAILPVVASHRRQEIGDGPARYIHPRTRHHPWRSLSIWTKPPRKRRCVSSPMACTP
jgi:hypothetical protein